MPGSAPAPEAVEASPAPAPAAPRHLAELDGLRGLSIVMVLLYHGWLYKGSSDVGRAITGVRSIGWAGVDVFFVLSGFLITGILIKTREQPRYWRNFLIRRGLRIFPLYYAVLIVLYVAGTLLASHGHAIPDLEPAKLDRVWINFCYITDFYVGIYGLNHVPLDIAWSLCIEEQFYLVFPAVVLLVRPPTLVKVLIAVIIAAPIFRGLVHAYGAQPIHGPYALPFCRMDALAIGALTRILLDRGVDRWARSVARAAPLLCAAALACLYLFARKDAVFAIAGYSLVAIAAASLLTRLLVAPPAALSRRVFSNRALVYVGTISYGLYLVHLIARSIVQLALGRVFHGAAQHTVWYAVLVCAGMIALALVIATLSFYLFESPILRLKDRWAPARPTLPPTAT